jgi:integrase
MLYRPTFTKPIPPDAEFFTRNGERFARYTDGRGKPKKARVKTTDAGVDRLVFTSPYWRARYRNGSGNKCDVPTCCRDEVAARSVANDLERRAELVKAGTIKPAEDAAADYAKLPLDQHFTAFIAHLRAKAVTDAHRKTAEQRLRCLANACGYSHLGDLNPEPVERWLVLRTEGGMSASARNGYREALISFGNWCVRTHRLPANPFLRVPRADEKSDPRRKRRAMTEDELRQLLFIARHRPLAELGREVIKTLKESEDGKRRGNWFMGRLTISNIDAAEQRARLKMSDDPDRIVRIEYAGRERELVYKAFVLTGLRKSELQSITVAQVDLDADPPCLLLYAGDEKNRHGSNIQLRSDLASDIRTWLTDRLHAMQAACLKAGEPIPMKLPGDLTLFNVPGGLLRIFNRDLVAAGIARIVKNPKTGKKVIDKRDERGRTVDVHALRTSFCTHMSKGGVAPATTQAAMRHSDIKLTMGTYTDPKLLDVRRALDVLPGLPLGDVIQPPQVSITGPDTLSGVGTPALASLLASAPGYQSTVGGTSDHEGHFTGAWTEAGGLAVSGVSVNTNGPQSTGDHEPSSFGATGFEPATSWSRTKRSSQAELRPV